MGLVTLTIDDAEPCPFCITDSTRTFQQKLSSTFGVWCVKCGTVGPTANTKSEAILRWNRRRTPTNAKPPPPLPTREEVEAVLRTHQLEDDDG